MKKIEIDSISKPIAAYSQGYIAGDFFFISGQGGLTPKNKIVADDIKNQAQQTMKNIQGILKAIEKDFSSVVKTTCYLKSMDDFKIFNEVYEEYFLTKPARTCVVVNELPMGILCEVEVISYIG